MNRYHLIIIRRLIKFILIILNCLSLQEAAYFNEIKEYMMMMMLFKNKI